MNTPTKPGVLAVMDHLISTYEYVTEAAPRAKEQQEHAEARAAVAELFASAWRAELLLRDMANAGFGDYGPADDLRAALAAFRGDA